MPEMTIGELLQQLQEQRQGLPQPPTPPPPWQGPPAPSQPGAWGPPGVNTIGAPYPKPGAWGPTVAGKEGAPYPNPAFPRPMGKVNPADRIVPPAIGGQDYGIADQPTMAQSGLIKPLPKAQEEYPGPKGLSYGSLDALKTVSEGLGNVHAKTAGDVMFGQNEPQPFVAEGLREAMGRSEDMLNPGERQFLSSMIGKPIPKDMTRSRLKMFFPGIMTYLALKEKAPIEQAKLAQGDQKIQIAQQNADTSAGRSQWGEEQGAAKVKQADERLKYQGQALGLSQGRFDRLDAPTRKQLQEIQFGLDDVNRVREGFHADQVGPVTGRINKALISLGVADKDVAVTNANVTDLLAQYVRSISGSQVHVSEFTRLAATHPQMVQNPEQFMAVLDNMEDVLRNRATMLTQMAKTQGMKTEGVQGLIDKNQPGTVRADRAGESIKVLDPKGNPGSIPAEDWEAAEKEGYTKR